MSRFIFKLEPLLEHRRQIEQFHQRKLAQVQLQINQLVQQIKNHQNAIAQQNQQLTADHLIGHLDLTYIANEKRFVGNLHALIATTMQRLAIIEKALLTARQELLAAAKSRKVIERLREKQHDRWLKDQQKREAEALDEISTQLTYRNLTDGFNAKQPIISTANDR